MFTREFTAAYMEASAFTLSVPGAKRFSCQAWRHARKDCKTFLTSARIFMTDDGVTARQHGHSFWFTRNNLSPCYPGNHHLDRLSRHFPPVIISAGRHGAIYFK